MLTSATPNQGLDHVILIIAQIRSIGSAVYRHLIVKLACQVGDLDDNLEHGLLAHRQIPDRTDQRRWIGKGAA